MSGDPMASVPPALLTVRQVAERLGVSRMTIYRLIDRDELRAYKIGRSIRVDPRDVVSLVRSGNTIAWEITGSGQA